MRDRPLPDATGHGVAIERGPGGGQRRGIQSRVSPPVIALEVVAERTQVLAAFRSRAVEFQQRPLRQPTGSASGPTVDARHVLLRAASATPTMTIG